jgi:hypothetical protein
MNNKTAKNVAKSTGLSYANLIICVSHTEYSILRKYSNEATSTVEGDAEDISKEDLDTFPERITVDTLRLLAAENTTNLPIIMSAFKLLFSDVDMRISTASDTEEPTLEYGTTVELLGTMPNEENYYVGVTTNFLGTTPHYVAESTMGDLSASMVGFDGNRKKTVEIYGDREHKLEKISPGVFAVKSAA